MARTSSSPKCFRSFGRRFPTAELRLVGPAPEEIAAYGRAPDGVKFCGFVPSLEEAYASARIVVCPIRYGGGTRVKLVEAAGWGKPIVSTTLGAEGLGMINDVHALIADSPEAACGCVRLAVCGRRKMFGALPCSAHARRRRIRCPTRVRAIGAYIHRRVNRKERDFSARWPVILKSILLTSICGAMLEAGEPLPR